MLEGKPAENVGRTQKMEMKPGYNTRRNEIQSKRVDASTKIYLQWLDLIKIRTLFTKTKRKIKASKLAQEDLAADLDVQIRKSSTQTENTPLLPDKKVLLTGDYNSYGFAVLSFK